MLGEQIRSFEGEIKDWEERNKGVEEVTVRYKDGTARKFASIGEALAADSEETDKKKKGKEDKEAIH